MARQVDKFVIVTGGRTGSTALCEWLNSNEKVRCHMEVFIRKHYYDPDGFWYYCNKSKNHKWVYKVLLNPRVGRYPMNFFSHVYVENYLNELLNNPNFSAPYTKVEERKKYIPNDHFHQENLVGFKVTYGSLNGNSGLRKWIHKNPCKIIHLTRSNILKMIASWRLANKTKVHHSLHRNRNCKVIINTDTIISEMERHLNNITKARNRLLNGNNPVLEIDYESFFINEPEKTKKLVRTFLGLEENINHKDFEYTKKLNSDNLSDIVDNYEDLYRKLKGTPYEHFLN